MEKKTPLYEEHLRAGGKMVPFAGYLLPVQYGTGVIAEHMAVRTACGLFDVSHMGEVLCAGPGAVACLNHLLTNDYTIMYNGQARYSPMCSEQGGVVDDLIVYKVRDECYFIVVNAANKEKDVAWMRAHAQRDVQLTDLSDQVAQLALQGPAARAILARLAGEEQLPAKYYSANFSGSVAGIPCVISRTGYTGEDGFELYLSPAEAPRMWELLLAEGAPEGLIPCGLGARDTLRLEASMPLYGHEMTDAVTPLEAGLGSFVKLEKPAFIGRGALLAQGEAPRVRVGLRVNGRGIVREACPLFSGGRQVGVSTSGTHCPYLGEPRAMALVERAFSTPGTALEAQVRGRPVAVEIVPLPFYKRARRG